MELITFTALSSKTASSVFGSTIVGYNVGSYRHLDVFLTGNQSVAGTARIWMRHSWDAARAAPVTFTLGSPFTTISTTSGAVREVKRFGAGTTLSFGQSVWATWSLSTGATVSFGLYGLLRD